MDLARAFTYIFDDEQWVGKIAMLAIVSLIPILSFATFGWLVALIRNMLDGYPYPLPDWDDFGQKFIDGLLIFLVTLIYSIPLFPLILLGPLADTFVNTQGGEFVVFTLVCFISLFVLAYALLISALLFIGMIRYAQVRDFNVYLQIGQNLRIAMNNIGTLAVLALMEVIAGVIFALFGWIPCIGWIVALALGVPVYGHLQGQAARQIMGAMGDTF